LQRGTRLYYLTFTAAQSARQQGANATQFYVKNKSEVQRCASE